MEAKKRIIYSNYPSIEVLTDIKEYLIEEGKPHEHADIWDQFNLDDAINWEGFEYDMKKFLTRRGRFILHGTCGCWDGNYEGGFVFETFDELRKAFGYDYLEVYDKNGHLYIKVTHHDGTNFYEVRELTDKGEEYYSNHYYDYGDRRLCTQLFKRMSRLPHYAHIVYGCKKREYC